MQSFISFLIAIAFYSYIIQVAINILRLTAFGEDDDRIKSVREFIWWLVPIIPSAIWVVKFSAKIYRNLKSLPW